MGFIKAIETAAKGQLSDTYREVIKYNNSNKELLLKKVTTANGIIQNESRLFVEPGQCAIYTDNGAIKDIITEPGMYFMDTSSPSLFQTNIFEGITKTFLETMKRVAYEGQTITTQAVYFISLAELTDLEFATNVNNLYKDPEWGPMEIGFAGSYGIKVTNPVNLLTNVNSNADECYFRNIRETVDNYVVSYIMKECNGLGVTFDNIPSKVNEIVDTLIKKVNKELDSLGIELTRVIISSVEVPQEIKEAMRNRTSIRMKATSVDDKAADVYTKLNTAEAIKDMANNTSNAGTSVMGMNLGNTVAGIINKNIDNEDK